jgi:hypothetical protein
VWILTAYCTTDALQAPTLLPEASMHIWKRSIVLLRPSGEKKSSNQANKLRKEALLI